ncbi:unnamed protein product [Rotaria magnacalcarata]|uniref:Uncharacterized protein n=1 Tax=Rotaria magnacalcarata TaxID=392030 RepID=A0A816KEM5_9BILA|nr:unnamed protein product [Rotaria magnacalcarata]
MFYQSEEVEILEEDELSSKARSTLSEIDKKQKDKREKKKGIFNVDRQLITTTLKPNREEDEMAAAEATLVYHGVRHGISYLAQQCTTTVLKNLFSSSLIANSLSCGRTKAAAIATDVLAPSFTHHVIQEMKLAFYYSLSFDASNKGNLKTYPFCVQYFSDEIDTLIEKPNVNEKNDAKNLSEFLSDFEGKIPGLSGFRRPNSGFSTVASGNPEHVVNNNIK